MTMIRYPLELTGTLRTARRPAICSLTSYLLSVLLGVGPSIVAGAQPPDGVIDLGSRRELMIDDHLVDNLGGGAVFRMHHPVRREIALVHDAVWEGNGGNYHTIFYDDDFQGQGLYRMYYHAWHIPADGNQSHPLYIAYAESRDGIQWRKPALGLIEHNGSKANNIVLATIGGSECHDLSVFKDPNPRAPREETYKAVGYGHKPPGLYGFKSPDGIHWSLYNQGEPILTGHAFDTQNIAFWDAQIGKYRAYIRDFDNGRRDIMTATSEDFVHWTKREWLRYPDAPPEQLYTNQIKPYYRADHLLIGFPTRYVDRGWTDATRALPSLKQRRQRAQASQRYGTAVTDALLMTSRDGLTFHRWDETFLRPGLRTRHNWAYGDNYLAWHVVETDATQDDAPRELSLYATESYFTGATSRLRRYTLRIDGFASVFAPRQAGTLTTKPVRFDGQTLNLNFSTSTAGSLRVEIQDRAGNPLPGYALADCDEMYGDTLDYPVRWRGNADVGSLAGKTIRLRFALRETDLYAFRFTPCLPQASARLSAAKPVKVVCFGDSVTGVYYHTGGRRAYPQILEMALRQVYPGTPVTVVNAGISGHTTGDALSRIQRDVLDHEPQVVTVMFGLNDLVRVPIDTFRSNLEAIVRKCREAGAEVLLCTPNSVIRDTPGRPRAKLLQYCQVIHQVGISEQVPVCDCQRSFALLRARNPLAWRLLMSDPFHPNMGGHKRIATELTRSMTGHRVDLSRISAPQPAIPKTLARLRAGQPVRVLAMSPFDRSIEPALKRIDPSARVQVTPWPVTDDDNLSQIEAAAKQVRQRELDLVLLAVPASATSETEEAFIHAQSWIMNWSLSFGRQEWDVVCVDPEVASPADRSSPPSHRRQLARRLVRAQDLTQIRRSTDDDASASTVLERWFQQQAGETPR